MQEIQIVSILRFYPGLVKMVILIIMKRKKTANAGEGEGKE